MRFLRYLPAILLFAVLLALTALTAWDVARASLPHWRLYRALGAGAVAYILLHAAIRKNIKWVETFAHETTHVAVSLLFMRDIREMTVSASGNGRAVTSGTRLADIPISLAPYCLPLFTFLLLLLRPLIRQEATPLAVFDVLTGLTLGLHLCCFATQTRRYQTDITRFPLLFSFLYILTFQLFNLSLIAVAYWPGQNLFKGLYNVGRMAIEHAWL